MKWEGHVKHMGERSGAYRGLMAKSAGKRPLEDLDVDGRKILQCIFKKWYGE